MVSDVKSLPLVSVIIPSYNHEAFIEESILSVVGQSYPNIELIVIDDGSSDTSRFKIDRLKLKYNFIYLEQKNEGVSRALNRAIACASGEYVSFLASDDVFYKNKISLLVNELDRCDSSTAMIFGDADLIDERGNTVEREYQGRRSSSFFDLYLSKVKKEALISSGVVDYVSLVEGNFIPAMSVLCKLDKLKLAGLFSERFSIEDYPMWLKLSKSFQIRLIDVPVAAYRQHGDNSIIRDRVKFIREQILILNLEFFNVLTRGGRLAYVYRYARLCLHYAKALFLK